VGVVNIHSPSFRSFGVFLLLLLDQDWISQPFGMHDFHNEARYQQFGDFFTDDLPSVFNKAMQGYFTSLASFQQISFNFKTLTPLSNNDGAIGYDAISLKTFSFKIACIVMQPKALWRPSLATYLYNLTYDTPASIYSYIAASKSL
jgi:hypothetical protein